MPNKVAEYGLNDWKNPTYKGNGVDLIRKPLLSVAYRGIQRY